MDLWLLMRDGWVCTERDTAQIISFLHRYHLQALRHLYVLAAEPRLLDPVDVDTDTPCYALLEVTYKVCKFCDTWRKKGLIL